MMEIKDFMVLRTSRHLSQILKETWCKEWASQVAQWLKNPFAYAGDASDVGSIPGLERSPGLGNGNPLQFPCLENSMEGGTW